MSLVVLSLRICRVALAGALCAPVVLAAQGAQRRPLPPPGTCRIWVDGVPADKQPAPTDCATALRNKPSNGQVLFGPAMLRPAIRSPRDSATAARDTGKAAKARRDSVVKKRPPGF